MKKYDNELDKNIRRCAAIRDGAESRTIAVIQAVRAIQKLIGKDTEHPEFDKNLDALINIRDDEAIEDTLRIMAMNSINTMLDATVGDRPDTPSADDIMKKIRGEKK